MGDYCTLHKPSLHHMLDWPMFFSLADRYIKRRCQHGALHTDPDVVVWSVKKALWVRHPCDCHCQCCTNPEAVGWEQTTSE